MSLTTINTVSLNDSITCPLGKYPIEPVDQNNHAFTIAFIQPSSFTF